MRWLPATILAVATTNICVCLSSNTRQAPSERFNQAEEGSVANFLMASSASGSNEGSNGIALMVESLARNISFKGHITFKYLSPVITSRSMRGLLLKLLCGSSSLTQEVPLANFRIDHEKA